MGESTFAVCVESNPQMRFPHRPRTSPAPRRFATRGAATHEGIRVPEERVLIRNSRSPSSARRSGRQPFGGGFQRQGIESRRALAVHHLQLAQ